MLALCYRCIGCFACSTVAKDQHEQLYNGLLLRLEECIIPVSGLMQVDHGKSLMPGSPSPFCMQCMTGYRTPHQVCQSMLGVQQALFMQDVMQGL